MPAAARAPGLPEPDRQVDRWDLRTARCRRPGSWSATQGQGAVRRPQLGDPLLEHRDPTGPVDPLEAAKALRRTRVAVLRPVRQADAELAVEQRPLADYDTPLGIDRDTGSEGEFASSPPGRQPNPRHVTLPGEVHFLTRALKPPTLPDAVPRLAERARAESWFHEEFLAACLQREVAARESHGAEGRIRAARFPARKSLEEFHFDYARGLKRDLIAHLGTLELHFCASHQPASQFGNDS